MQWVFLVFAMVHHCVSSGCLHLPVSPFPLKGFPMSLLRRLPWEPPSPGSGGTEMRSVLFVFSSFLTGYHWPHNINMMAIWSQYQVLTVNFPVNFHNTEHSFPEFLLVIQNTLPSYTAKHYATACVSVVCAKENSKLQSPVICQVGVNLEAGMAVALTKTWSQTLPMLGLITHWICVLRAWQIRLQSDSNQFLNGLLTPKLVYVWKALQAR